MTHRTAMGIVFLMLAQGLAGCGGSGSSSAPTAPSAGPLPGAQSVPPPVSINGLMVFTDQASGFSTSDLRDAHEQIVQFNTASELIWTADGTHLPGYPRQGNAISAEASCKCWLVVRFGTSNGQRRAYLTADYGHDNPGTVVDLAITGGALVVSRTNVFAPGTYTQSGVVTEETETGPAPLENAGVWRLNEEQSGWQVGTTDKNGFYEIRGLYDGSRAIGVFKDGYKSVETFVAINGDTRFDAQLVRR
jgi:hypothetical protein